MELHPLGPVLFIDTAGIDDVGTLGELRVKKTWLAFDRTDLGVIVTDGQWREFEEGVLREMTEREIPVVVVHNKADLRRPSAEVMAALTARGIRQVSTVASRGDGIVEFRQALVETAPADFINNPVIIGDLVERGELAVLVIPIDKEAPKGRLILPQVQTIRDILDHDGYCIMVKENELRDALARLNRPPKIVVTDSQAFQRVAADTPREILLTSFSILYARFKGDLVTQTRGVLAIEDLKPGDRVLVAEACSHHPIAEDIGRVKIPRWLTRFVGGALQFSTVQGHDFPEDLSPYRLVIHCGACMWNRREMLTRLLRCRRAGVPVTNYGLVVAYSLGIIERALEPFPEALEAFHSSSRTVAQDA